MQSKDSVSSSVKKKLQIGSLTINSPVVLAPMAGITDKVLRSMVRMFSSDCLLFTEMISSEALFYNNSGEILDHDRSELPLAFQISGHKPELMAHAAKKLEEFASVIDINMGCPAPKIVKNFDGAKLMTDLKLSSSIITAVKNAVDLPVTVKCRLGWDSSSKNHIEFAEMAEDSGADAIIMHGRTRAQQYSGRADWNAIGETKTRVKIPVIANGDIDSPQKALSCLEISGCDGIAVGRGVLGDPGLINRIERYINDREDLPEPSIKQRIELALLHCKKEMEFRGEEAGIKFMRKFFAYYIREIRNAAKYRHDLVRVNRYSDIEQLFFKIAVDIEE